MKGNIVYGETNIKECHLGETLVRHGILTSWDLERSMEMIQATGHRLGQVLVELGTLDANGLEDALAIHVRELLLTVFSWREGSYRFDEQELTNMNGQGVLETRWRRESQAPRGPARDSVPCT